MLYCYSLSACVVHATLENINACLLYNAHKIVDKKVLRIYLGTYYLWILNIPKYLYGLSLFFIIAKSFVEGELCATYYLKENNCPLSNALNFFWKLFAFGTLCFKGLLKLSKKYFSTVITFLFILGVILKFYGLDSPSPLVNLQGLFMNPLFQNHRYLTFDFFF